MKANVGEIRQQSAFADADRPVIIISDDEELKTLLGARNLRVVEFYPDTTDGDGKWRSTFKIKVAIDKLRVKKAVLWWLVTGVVPTILTVDDQRIESLIPLVSALFPGINYHSSVTGFNQVMCACVIPVLKKRFPEFQTDLVGTVVQSDEEVEIELFLPSQGYEWQESEVWQKRFSELLAA